MFIHWSAEFVMPSLAESNFFWKTLLGKSNFVFSTKFIT